MNSSGTQGTRRGGAGTLRSGVLLWTWLAPRGAQPFHLGAEEQHLGLLLALRGAGQSGPGSTLDYHREGLLRPSSQAAPCMGSRDRKKWRLAA